MQMDRHHLLEIILWPNGDGTFRKIINTEERLRELGIYDDWKLTITIPANVHSTMHSHNRPDGYWDKVSKTMSEVKKLNPIRYWKNKNLSEEHRQKISDSLKGNKPWNKGLKTGIVTSDETKAKLSASLKGRHKVIIDGKIRFVK